MTIWIAIWGNDHDLNQKDLFQFATDDVSDEAFDLKSEKDGREYRLSYRLAEDSDDERIPAFYCYVVGHNGFVQVAMYMDSEECLDMAKGILRSLSEADTP